MRLLRLPWIIPMIVLSALLLKFAKVLVGLKFQLASERLGDLVIMDPILLLFCIAIGMLCFSVFAKVQAGPFGFAAVMIAVNAAIWSAQQNEAVNINSSYNTILISLCVIEGFALQGWAKFAARKSNELYMREVDKQAQEFFEKEMIPEAEKLRREQENS